MKLKQTLLLLTILISTSTFAEPPSLKTVMMKIGVKTQSILRGMLNDNFRQIAKSAVYVIDHPKPANDIPKIKAELGIEMKEFKRIDMLVHDSATGIIEAAQNEDMEAVAKNFGIMTTNCIACHDSFRERIRDVLYNN